MKNKQSYTKEQMYDLIRKWETSNLSQKEFIASQSISKSTFYYWKKRYLQESNGNKPGTALIPIHILSSAQPEHKAALHRLEIVYPNGVRIICPDQMDAIRVKDLIF